MKLTESPGDVSAQDHLRIAKSIRPARHKRTCSKTQAKLRWPFVLKNMCSPFQVNQPMFCGPKARYARLTSSGLAVGWRPRVSKCRSNSRGAADVLVSALVTSRYHFMELRINEVQTQHMNLKFLDPLFSLLAQVYGFGDLFLVKMTCPRHRRS